jgi:hypothetical protein
LMLWLGSLLRSCVPPPATTPLNLHPSTRPSAARLSLPRHVCPRSYIRPLHHPLDAQRHCRLLICVQAQGPNQHTSAVRISCPPRPSPAVVYIICALPSPLERREEFQETSFPPPISVTRPAVLYPWANLPVFIESIFRLLSPKNNSVHGMDNHWNVTTSSGRRVSLLCEDNKADYHTYSSYPSPYASSTATPTPPPSPDYYRRPYPPVRTDSIGSVSSSASSRSSVSSSGSLYSPKTPPNLSLPPLDKMLPIPQGQFFSPLPEKLTATSPVLVPVDDNKVSPSSARSTAGSSSPSPKSSAANPVVKRASRRYTCHCGKSFTTSGHLARHTRIHTGEKNYVCPEAGCGARFSRQDNCMQHFRTHQNGSSNKRASRKRRLSTDNASTPPNAAASTVASSPSPAPSQAEPIMIDPLLTARSFSLSGAQPLLYPAQFVEPFTTDTGLAALANAACSKY